ncbi:MAG: MucB/RseB C-terminal domain-containing protein, partial [Glaciecola sp.]
ISQLPIGMLEQKRQVHRLAITGELVEYMLLSDGLVDVSIYLQKAGSVAQDDVLLRNQAETLLSRVRDGLQLTVIGKIPAPTANKLMELISTTP